MKHYTVKYRKSVDKELRKLSKPALADVVKRILSLADNPRPAGAIRLQGGLGLYRVRQGDYRIIYSINDRTVTVLVVKVGHRGDVYDKI
jgi:mRNA interferase RelE/StbE